MQGKPIRISLPEYPYNYYLTHLQCQAVDQDDEQINGDDKDASDAVVELNKPRDVVELMRTFTVAHTHAIHAV